MPPGMSLSTSTQVTSETAPPRSQSPITPPTWKIHVAQAIRDPVELCALLGLPPELAVDAEAAMGEFPLLLPRPMLARIKPGDIGDPVLRQFLPTRAECARMPGFSPDPLEEQTACPLPGVLTKYEGRILILTTPACAVHCRYCFRRHFPYTDIGQSAHGIKRAVSEKETPKNGFSHTISEGARDAVCRYLETRPDCREVILSGGEPLLLDDTELERWLALLAHIPHIARVRIHTRLPVVIPHRVTPGLINLLRGTRLQSVVVLHINHPQEIDETVAEAIGRLNASGAIILCQSVLLAGINDNPEVLAALYERLFRLRVLPYYLHQLDRVLGAHHFEVPITRGKQIVAELRKRLPGYLVPRYVQEQPGEKAKVPL